MFAIVTCCFSSHRHEIILVDNNSTDGTVEMLLAEFPDVTLLPQKSNSGFSKANNIGASKAKGAYLFFLNNDTLFREDILAPLHAFMDTDESIGIVSPMLLDQDGAYQLSYGKNPSIMNELWTRKETATIKVLQKIIRQNKLIGVFCSSDDSKVGF